MNGRDPDGGYYNPGGHNVAVDLKRVYTGGNIEDVRWVNVAGKGYNPYGPNRAETRLEARDRLTLELRAALREIRVRSGYVNGLPSPTNTYDKYYGYSSSSFMEFFSNTKQIEEAVRAVEMKYQGAINELGLGSSIELPDMSSLRATLNNDLLERWQSNQGFRDLVAANDFKMQWQEQFDQLQLDMEIHNWHQGQIAGNVYTTEVGNLAYEGGGGNVNESQTLYGLNIAGTAIFGGGGSAGVNLVWGGGQFDIQPFTGVGVGGDIGFSGQFQIHKSFGGNISVSDLAGPSAQWNLGYGGDVSFSLPQGSMFEATYGYEPKYFSIGVGGTIGFGASIQRLKSWSFFH